MKRFLLRTTLAVPVEGGIVVVDEVVDGGESVVEAAVVVEKLGFDVAGTGCSIMLLFHLLPDSARIAVTPVNRDKRHECGLADEL